MNIEIRKLTPELTEDYIHFSTPRPIIRNIISNAIVFFGAMTTVKARIFTPKSKKEIMPSNM